MKLSGCKYDSTTHHLLILRHARADNLEAALFQLDKLRLAKLPPLLESINTVALLAIKHGEVKIAHELVIRAEEQSVENDEAPTNIPPETWFQLLESAAELNYVSCSSSPLDAAVSD